MELCKEGHSYANRVNAVRALEGALARMDRALDDVRWMIVVKEDGRCVPVVVPGREAAVLLPLVNCNVSVVG